MTTITDLINGVDFDKVDTIQWDCPTATTDNFCKIFQDTKCEALSPTEDEIKNLQIVFDLIAEESDSLPWLDLLCIAFGNEEVPLAKEGFNFNYLQDTPATMIEFDYNNLLSEIRRVYISKFVR